MQTLSVYISSTDNRVHVTGARGSAPPPTLKCTGTYTDGYRVTAAAIVIGGDAAAKARRTAEAIIARLSQGFFGVQVALQKPLTELWHSSCPFFSRKKVYERIISRIGAWHHAFCV